jgi:hypothetical protein
MSLLRLRSGAVLCGALLLPALAAAPAAAQTAIRAGQTVTGSLASSDLQLSDNSYADQYLYRGRRGERLTITLRSGAFDGYLHFGTGRGASFSSSETDDDGAGGTDSKIEVTLAADGEYVIQANSLAASETGAYTLQVESSGGAPDGGGGSPGGGASGGERVERGALARGDGTLQTGEYRDSYTVAGRRGERLVVDMRSSDMDPYLIVIGPDGKQQENDDFEGDQHRSLVSMELPQDGEYRVLATTYRPNTTGSYELRIRSGGGESASGATRSERGELRAGDETLKTGEFVDRYTVQALPGQRLRVDMSSSAFDTYVIVKDPKNEQSENDDAEGQPGHAIVEMETTEAGTYTILATSYGKAETGAYQLAIELGAAGGNPGRARPADAAALTLGGTVNGRLQEGDRTLQNSGEFSDAYLVEGRPGQTLVVEMNSGDFDTYLLVRTPGGESFDNDDDNGSSDRSRLEVPMREAGRYRVVATSYRRGETGAYTLTARGTAASRPTQAAAVANQPSAAGAGRMGTGRGGRVYGVFVGVSDYGGRASNLSFTARDATTMRDAMIRGVGMRAADAVVLTDRQATVANVRAAVQQMATKVGPNDIFIFFHSGHGSRVAVRGPDDDDPDGMDETIEMFDAEIRDDEMGRMLDAVNSGMSMLVIDACFSGGFSKDVINKPGRVGFFSSEEDVVSAVATKFRAGGFLPVFFAEAVGEHRGDVENAELTPQQDRQLTLLELSQYLRERYGTEVKSDVAGPGGGVQRRELNYQHLVVDRGGVDAYTVLFRW